MKKSTVTAIINALAAAEKNVNIPQQVVPRLHLDAGWCERFVFAGPN
jgi:hypothetical protein